MGRPNGYATDDRDWSHLSPRGQATPTIRESIERNQRRKSTAATKKVYSAARYPEGTLFIMLPLDMIQSHAWCALLTVPSAAKVVFRLIAEHLEHALLRNGDLIVTYDQFTQFGIRRKSVNSAITIAERLGFVDVIRGRRAKHGYDRLPNRYRLTFEPTHDAEHRSNRWRSEECELHARELLKERAQALASRPQQWGRSCQS
jgi:hypothetical protein